MRILKWNLAVFVLSVPATFLAGLNGAEQDAHTPAGSKAVGVDTSRVMGVRICLGCHGAETLSWMKSAHHRSQLILRAPNARKYAAALGVVPAKIRESQACIRCHATGQRDQHGVVRASIGVSCESYHGASGGNEGWLNAHAVYGPNGTSFEQETEEHLKRRLGRVQKAGMIRSHQIYDMARKCLACHLVEDEALVNAGHKIGKSFDFLSQTTGELLHNFHEDQTVNAAGPTLWARRTGGEFRQRERKKFVVGLLVEIEMALLAVSQVEDGSDYSDSLIERAVDGWGVLAEFSEELEDDFPEKLLGFVEQLEEIEDIDVSDGDSRRQAATWGAAAGTLAREYDKEDGTSLEVLDELLEDYVEP
ncbi:MAG: multiheme c-type cytochrome, partial [Planctomycetaceae bacterium]